MSLLAESTKVLQCQAGDKIASVLVDVEFRQLPIESSAHSMKQTHFEKTFSDSFSEYSSAKSSEHSSSSSTSASVGFGEFSASVDTSFSSVSNRASTLDRTTGGAKEDEVYGETDISEKETFQEGQLQVIRDKRTIVLIDGVSASIESHEIVHHTSLANRYTYEGLEELARDYITDHYGNEKHGAISANGEIFTQSKCFRGPDGPPGRVNYKVIITTSDATNAGTDSDIYITITGTLGNTNEVEIDTLTGNNLNTGNTDTIAFDAENVGYITSVEFRMDGSDGWNVQRVQIYKDCVLAFDQKEDQWIDDSGTGKFARNRVFYQVEITTSDDDDDAGSDMTIYMTIQGSLGDTSEVALDAPGDDFEKGETDTHSLYHDNIGDFKCVVLRMDGNDGWKVQRVKVYGNEVLVFEKDNIGQWLDDNGSISICE